MPGQADPQKLDSFLQKNSLELVGKIAKGWSSEIFLCRGKSGKLACLKALRGKSNRQDMVLREAENLALANSAGVGPKLIGSDAECSFVSMEYIEGIPFSEWIFETPSKESLSVFIDELYKQAKALDKIGLDHGQLAGRGKNILVAKETGLPVIIDFEKASPKRKCHNVKVLDSFLYRSKDSAIVKKVKEILG